MYKNEDFERFYFRYKAETYSDMTETEKSKLIELLIEQRDESRRREEAASCEREELQKRLVELTEKMSGMMDQICELPKLLKEKDIENAKLKGRVDLSNRNKYSRTSQKKSGSRKDDGNKPTSHTDTW